MIDLLRVERALDHHVCCGERLVHVPFFDLARAGDIVLNLNFLWTPQHRVINRLGARLHRFNGVGENRQNLVFDLDGTHRLFGQLLGLCSDGGDRLSHPTHLVGQDVMVFVQDRRDGDDALVVSHLGDVIKGDHDRPHCFRRAGVNVLDPRVGVRAGQNAPVEHVWQGQVYRILLLPCHAGDAIFTRRHLAYRMKRLFLHHATFPVVSGQWSVVSGQYGELVEAPGH